MTRLVKQHCPVYGTIRINGKGIIKEGDTSGLSVNICACRLRGHPASPPPPSLRECYGINLSSYTWSSGLDCNTYGLGPQPPYFKKKERPEGVISNIHYLLINQFLVKP